MTEKHISFDIDDPRATKVAEVLSNSTCKKILGLLAEKEMSESDIASALNLPLNTVGYNVKKLLDANLIDKSKTYFWSAKGKKIPTYKVSNKKIIISPKKLMTGPIAIILGAILTVALIAFVAMQFSPSEDPGVITNDNPNTNPELKQFSSYEELEEFVKASTNSNSMYYGRDMAMSEGMATAGAPSSLGSDSSKSSAESYSGTNVQTTGVDEADIVKSDGKYLYTISGNKVVIVDAYPADNMKVISEIEFNISNSVRNIFVNDDKLVVFVQTYNYYPLAAASEKMAGVSSSSIAPCWYGGCGSSESRTFVEIYDISDRENPTLEKNFSVSGNYHEARMIDENVYLVSNEYLYGNVPRPYYSIDGVERSIALSDIYYFDMYDSSYVFNTISSFNLDNGEMNAKVYLTGSTSNIYVSGENIYLVSEKRLSYTNYQTRMIEEGIIPTLASSERQKAEEIMDSDKEIYSKYNAVMNLVTEYADSLNGESQESFSQELRDSISEFEQKIQKEQEQSVIHKIKIDNGNIDYESKGEVPGRVLNQFSLDEFEGNLRIATTTGQTWNGASANHLYVLDEGLQVIGRVENLAAGEQIYSVRFIGEKAYMVTFRQTDPLYAIDLSDPANPNVLGYLKITGYSSYLHPYDENHIIGIGMEANTEGRVNGLKIAIFDVSLAQPNLNVAYTLSFEEAGWSSSDALYDHKAFLFDKEKGILVIPVSVSSYQNGMYSSWQGAYVFDVSTTSITLKGKIDHFDTYVPQYKPASEEAVGAKRNDTYGNVWRKVSISDEGDGFWKTTTRGYEQSIWGDDTIDQQKGGVDYREYTYDYNSYVQRSLYMDDALYTVSTKKVKANSLSDLVEIKTVNLPYEEPVYNGGPYSYSEYAEDSVAVA